jgi:hypothetical protein
MYTNAFLNITLGRRALLFHFNTSCNIKGRNLHHVRCGLCVLQTMQLWLCWCQIGLATVVWSATKRGRDTFSITLPFFLFVLANVHNQQNTYNLPGTIQCIFGHTVKLVWPISWRLSERVYANVFLQGVQNCPFCIEIIFAFLPLLNWITTVDSVAHGMAFSFLQKARVRANLFIFVNQKC